MRSKLLSLPLALALAAALPFAACSKSEPASTNAPTQQAQAAPPAAAPAETPAESPGTEAAPEAQPEAQPEAIAAAKPKAEAAAKPATKKSAKNGAKAASKKEGRKQPQKAAGVDSTISLGLRVERELLQKLGADALQVEAKADGGKVVLSGAVTKRETAELADDVAGKVSGVASVENKLQVAPVAGSGNQVERAVAETEHELADATLETEVQIALVDKMGSGGLRIDTDAASGVVTLAFPKKMKPARRNNAVEIAKKVSGVSKVVSLDKH